MSVARILQRRQNSNQIDIFDFFFIVEIIIKTIHVNFYVQLMILTCLSTGVAVPEGLVDLDPACRHPHQAAGCGQGLVQHLRDQLRGLPDLQAEEVYGDGEVHDAGRGSYTKINSIPVFLDENN